MITTSNLPNGYRPYSSIDLCGNKLLGGGHILSLGEVLPLVIGAGAKPLLWMQAITDVKTKSFITIVEASIPTLPAVRIKAEDSAVVVLVGIVRVLVVKKVSEDAIEIPEIDLRPIGVNLYGKNGDLYAGTMQFSGNTFSGGGTFIGFTL